MTDLLPIVASASVTNGSDTITVTGTDASTGATAVLNDLNTRPNAQVLLAGVGYLVKKRLTTTTLQLERDFEGTTATGLSCTIGIFTPEMASRTALSQLLQQYDARARLIAMNEAGLSYIYSDATTGAPASGQLMFDNTDLTAVTKIWLNNADANAQTITDRIDRWGVGDEITARAVDGSGRVTYLVGVAPVDETGYRQVTVTYSGKSGVLSAGADVVVERIAKGIAGLVGVEKGNYDAGTAYTKTDMVTDQGSSWIYTNATDAAGNAPPVLPTTSNSYWQLVVQQGIQGIQGDPGLIGNWRGDWATSTTYAVNDAVSQGGSGYICLVAHTSGTFATDLAASKWELVVSRGAPGTNGTDGTVQTVVAGAGITVDSTDPANPVVAASSSGASAAPRNLGLAFSVASGALTVALKQADGSTDPTSGAPVMVPMTAGSGAVTEIAATGALSLVVPSGATLAHTSALNGHLYWYGIDNSGSLELAVSQTYFGQSGTVSTTAMDASADSGTVMYSESARTDVPFRLIARSIDTQTTAGTWATTPSGVGIEPPGPFDVNFKAYLNSAQSIAAATNTKINFDTKLFDSGGFYDNVTNYRFQPPAGKYLIGGSMYVSGFTDGAYAELNLNRNGSVDSVLCVSQSSSTGSPFAVGSTIITANGTDYFELIGYQNSGTTRSIYNAGAPGVTNFWAERVDTP